LVAGCATDKFERGPEGTRAYNVTIESSVPGARVEADGDSIGNTPLTLKIFGDKDGTFHNFGSSDYVIKVYPVKPEHRVQTRVYRTGRWFSPEDRIPSRIYIDFDAKPEGFSIDLPPPPPKQP